MSDDSSSDINERENKFCMLLLREIPREGKTLKDIVKLFNSKVISFLIKLELCKSDPLFSRIRETIKNMEQENLNVDTESIYKTAIHQNKQLLLKEIHKYRKEDDPKYKDTIKKAYAREMTAGVRLKPTLKRKRHDLRDIFHKKNR